MQRDGDRRALAPVPYGEPPASAQVYRLRYQGIAYELPPTEFTLLLHGVAAHLRSDLLVAAVRAFNGAVATYNHHVAISNEQRIVGWLLETTSGAELPDVSIEMARSALDSSRAAVDALQPPTAAGVLRTAEALRLAESFTNGAVHDLRAYREQVIGSGEDG